MDSQGGGNVCFCPVMETSKVDLCLAEFEFCWVETNSILRAVGDVIDSVPEAFFNVFIP